MVQNSTAKMLLENSEPADWETAAKSIDQPFVGSDEFGFGGNGQGDVDAVVDRSIKVGGDFESFGQDRPAWQRPKGAVQHCL